MDSWHGRPLLEWQAITDQEGYFEWDAVPEESVRLSITKEDYYPLRNVALTSETDQPIFYLDPILRVTGKVLDVETQQPIPQFKITLGQYYGSNNPPYWEHNSSVSGSDGIFTYRYRERIPPTNPVCFMVEASGYLPGTSIPFPGFGWHEYPFQLKRGRATQEIVPGTANGSQNAGRYRSPLETAFSPDGRFLAMSDRTAESLLLLEASTRQLIKEVQLLGRAAGLVWSEDSQSFYVAEQSAGSIAEVDISGVIKRRMAVSTQPYGLAQAPRRGWLLATDRATAVVHVLDVKLGRPLAAIPVVREPFAVAVTPDEKWAVVSNRLPLGDASQRRISALISLLDLSVLGQRIDILLPPNSANVHGVCISPQGRWAYVVHNVGRTMLPTDQIELGWISANALTVIDLQRQKHYATVFLDQGGQGLANPWGVTLSRDGQTLWIAISSTHEVAVVHLSRLHELLAERLAKLPNHGWPTSPSLADELPSRPPVFLSDTAFLNRSRAGTMELMMRDLPPDYGAGQYFTKVLSRIRLPGQGPRGLALSPDGQQLAVAQYFSASVVFIQAPTSVLLGEVQIGPPLEMAEARRGEMIFHDATHCYQQWLSCATCHPEGRADGLNWDLLNDGLGNAKNTKSLLHAHLTPPAMSEGVREDATTAIAAGFRAILFQPAPPADIQAVEAYVWSLKPEPGPIRAGAELSVRIQRGQALFDSPRTQCSQCHPPPLFTDGLSHDVGTAASFDHTPSFDTPSLVELWRTAPYLHHGQAITLKTLLTDFNRHGETSGLSSEELEDLLTYLMSL